MFYTIQKALMKTIITRIGFCLDCNLQRRPQTDHPFLVYGSTSGYHHRFAQRIGMYGFVPTIYELVKTIGENVIVNKLCSIEGCGSEWYNSNGVWYLQPIKGRWKREMYTIQSWNALVVWKHDWDYWI